MTENDTSPEAEAASQGIMALARYAEVCAREVWLTMPLHKRTPQELKRLTFGTLVGVLIQRLSLTHDEVKLLAEAAALLHRQYSDMKDVLKI